MDLLERRRAICARDQGWGIPGRNRHRPNGLTLRPPRRAAIEFIGSARAASYEWNEAGWGIPPIVRGHPDVTTVDALRALAIEFGAPCLGGFASDPSEVTPYES